jgi:UPF0716 protein FxsA
MPLLLLFLFLALPILELYVIIQVGQAIGILPTLALLIADSILGTVLLRSQGRNAWRRFLAAMDESRVPHREVFDGAMVILGGALLLTPGFITDIFGIICLLPPTRAVLWQIGKRYVIGKVSFGPRVATWGTGAWGPPPGAGRPHGSAGPRPGDIDGTAQEVREPDGQLPDPGRSREE